MWKKWEGKKLYKTLESNPEIRTVNRFTSTKLNNRNILYLMSTCMCVCVCVCVQRVSNSLYPMDYIVQGILQARILEWAAFPFSRGPSQPRDQTQVSRIAGRFFTTEPQGKLTQLKNRKILYLRCTCVCVRVCICKALSIYFFLEFQSVNFKVGQNLILKP